MAQVFCMDLDNSNKPPPSPIQRPQQLEPSPHASPLALPSPLISNKVRVTERGTPLLKLDTSFAHPKLPEAILRKDTPMPHVEIKVPPPAKLQDKRRRLGLELHRRDMSMTVKPRTYATCLGVERTGSPFRATRLFKKRSRSVLGEISQGRSHPDEGSREREGRGRSREDKKLIHHAHDDGDEREGDEEGAGAFL